MPGLNENFSVYLGEYGLKISAILILLLNIKGAIRILKDKKIKVILIFLFLLFLLRTVHSTSASGFPVDFMTSIIWLIIIYSSIRTEKHFKILAFCIYVSALIVLLSAGIDRIFDVSRVGFTEDRSSNALTGIAPHYIIYGQMALISFYMSIYFLYEKKSKFLKFFLLFFLITSFMGIITSGSRGAILAIIVSIAFFLFKTKIIQGKKTLKFGFLIIASLITLFSFISFDSLFYSFRVIGTSNDISSINRLNILNLSIQSFYNAPFFGNGWDYVRLVHGITSHSVPFQLLAELGLLGLVLEYFIYFKLLKLPDSFKSNVYHNKSYLKSIIFLSLIIAFGFWSIFENLGFSLGTRQLYFVTALIICYVEIYKLKFVKL